jgi:hypothetical protein
LSIHYEVLSPWAEIDYVPLKGITTRLENLTNKKIGLYCNFKEVARPLLTTLENTLKNKFPSCQFDWYFNPRMGSAEIESDHKAKFVEWISQVDAVVFAIGD